MRNTTSLNGQWEFQLDPQGQLSLEGLQPDRVIPVPMPIQAAFPELRQYSGYMWYRRTFTVDDHDGELLLDFGAVDYWCQIYINGNCVAEHEGGYTPIRIPIRRFVQSGENTLAVRVYDTVQTEISIPRWIERPAPETSQPPFNAETIPHGKQTWYIDASGIWQNVTLTPVPTRYIDRAHITPDIHTGDAHVRVWLGGAVQSGTLRVTIKGVSAETSVAAGQSEASVTVRVPDVQWWSPDTPVLYTASVEFEADSLDVHFGYRQISTRDGVLLLNGQPFYLLCALDQDLYPDTIYTVPSEDFLRDQFIKAKQLGLNSLRCHIKPPDPIYHDLADELGLLIWAEIPSWRTFYGAKSNHPDAYYLDDAVKNRARAILEDMIARDFNHPSLMIWTLINEDWGSTLLLSQDDRDWITELYDYAKQLDPTRLVVDNSPCPAPWGLSVHVKSDLDDFHVYTNIPDQADIFEQFVEQFGMRPLWSYSNIGGVQRTGKEPLILSEFGNWGAPSLKQFGGGMPDWADLSGWWSPFDGEAGRAEGLLDRFAELGLNAIWKDYEAFAEATQWHEYHALKFEIETMRRLKRLQGYVITEMSDIYWESNGLLDFARGTKVFHDKFSEFNAEDVMVPEFERTTYWSDEGARVRFHVSHYSAKDWANARATVTTESSETLLTAEVGDLTRGDVRDLGRARWKMPDVSTAQHAQLTLTVANGTQLARNTASVLVLPAESSKAAYKGEVAAILRLDKGSTQNATLYTSSSAPAAAAVTGLPTDDVEEMHSMGKLMLQSGYQISRSIGASTSLTITDHPTEEILDWVRAGGDLLYLANSGGSPFYWVQGRGGTYGGRWVTSWNWLRPGVYRRIPVENPLTLPFMDMTPQSVLLGLPVSDSAFHGDFLAGQVAGWVRHPAIHTVQFRYGQGRVVMTTYPIREKLRFQPLALAMLHDLVDHLTSEACQPVLQPNF